MAPKTLRILVIGGTGFIGSHYVNTAVARGHTVTVFSRATKPRALPPSVEVIAGDRNKGLSGTLDRDWDAVIDLAAFAPHGVRSLGEVLKDRIRHYTLLSTNAVYDRPETQAITTETSSLRAYEGRDDVYSLRYFKTLHEYGALKALCEREAEKSFPGRTLVLRPGWVFGPGSNLFFFAYWPARTEYGGEMLAAGDPATPIQFVDVRDLAEWSLSMIEERATGTYNVLGPAVPTRLDRLIAAARAPTSPPGTLTWVPSSWLAAQKDRGLWRNVLFWTYEADGFAGMMRMSIDRALKAGFTTRPIAVTLSDSLDWYKQQSPDAQATLLMATKSKEDGTGVESVPVSWAVYLEREKALLADWQGQQAKQR